jgi:6-pyruvoyltetrahydropterin/6-carboxytetrahydropterin synthase
MDGDALDAIVCREVVDRYDHRHFNYDIPEFAGLVPSAEVITRIIWDRLRPLIQAPVRLHKVLLRETARNIFEYAGEEPTDR